MQFLNLLLPFINDFKKYKYSYRKVMLNNPFNSSQKSEIDDDSLKIYFYTHLCKDLEVFLHLLLEKIVLASIL